MDKRKFTRTELMAACHAAGDQCGCYYCLTIYPLFNVEKWINDGKTALCPNCGIDAVVPIRALLDSLHSRWFGPPTNQPVRPTFLDGIVEFERWDIMNPMNGMDYLHMGMYRATFVVDFGPWKKGQCVTCSYFDPFHGTLSEGNNQDELIASCKISIVPKKD